VGSPLAIEPPGSPAAELRRPETGRRTRAACATVRRIVGTTADQIVVQCRPGDLVSGASRQAESLYEALRDVLAAEGAGPDAVVSETVFFRHVREDVEVARRARARVFGAGLAAGGPATTRIGQPPLDDHAELEVSATAMVPSSGIASSTDELRVVACPCVACAPGVRARVVRLGAETHLHAGNIHGAGRDAVAEAFDMFRIAEDLLAGAGMSFHDVIRTWIHLRDVDRDYAALNAARREFLRQRRIARRPASSGVQGTPFPDSHRMSLSLYAATSSRPLDVTPMSTPLLNEAWIYGAEFSRGLRVADANAVTLHVSGTASIDDAGRTVHPGKLAAQAERMLHNVASLLVRQGATFDDLMSGVAYLKHRGDAPALRETFRRHGFDGFPCTLVEAPLCRPELLCEVEVVATLPHGRAGV